MLTHPTPSYKLNRIARLERNTGRRKNYTSGFENESNSVDKKVERGLDEKMDEEKEMWIRSGLGGTRKLVMGDRGMRRQVSRESGRANSSSSRPHLDLHQRENDVKMVGSGKASETVCSVKDSLSSHLAGTIAD